LPVLVGLRTGQLVGADLQIFPDAHVAEQATPFNRALQSGAAGLFYGPSTPFGIQGLEAQVQHHALVAAYANDFMLMFWVCLPMLPLLFFMKKPQTKMLKPAELAME